MEASRIFYLRLFACIRGYFTGSSRALERRAIPLVTGENLTGLYVLNGYGPSLLAPGFWLLTPLLVLPTSLANITLSRQMEKLRRASLGLLELL